jgi:hypothetical protein
MTWRACAAQIRPPGFLPGLLLAAAHGAAGLTLLTGPALAAEGAKGGASEVIFLAQLITLMLVGRLLGEAMNRIGQPSIMGMLLGGILLGPSALGALLPDLQHTLFPKTPEQKAMLDGISQFGILLLLLLTGMETDLRLVRRVGRAALSISLTGVAVPFACGFALGQFMPESLLPHPTSVSSHRYSLGPRSRFPPSRSWRRSCARWVSPAAISGRSSSPRRSVKTRSAGSSLRSRSASRKQAASIS